MDCIYVKHNRLLKFIVQIFLYFHSTSGCTDYFAENESDALRLGRDIVASLNVTCNDMLDSHKYDEPLFDVEELPGIIPAPHNHHKIDMYKVIIV